MNKINIEDIRVGVKVRLRRTIELGEMTFHREGSIGTVVSTVPTPYGSIRYSILFDECKCGQRQICDSFTFAFPDEKGTDWVEILKRKPGNRWNLIATND